MQHDPAAEVAAAHDDQVPGDAVYAQALEEAAAEPAPEAASETPESAEAAEPADAEAAPAEDKG
jgi:hypothetical protein